MIGSRISYIRRLIVAIATVQQLHAQVNRVSDAVPVTIRGRVVSATGGPLGGVSVVVTASRSRSEIQVRTNDLGVFSIVLPTSDTTAWISVTMPGFKAQRRLADRAVAVAGVVKVDFTLIEIVTHLESARIVAERPRPPRDMLGRSASPGANQAPLGGDSGVSGDLTGDPTAVLGMIPGVTVVPNSDGSFTTSAFGLRDDQNGKTLNGSDFTGTLPRDGLLQTVRLSTYDPKNGRFGGLQVINTLPSGSFLDLRSLHVTLDDPALQYTTASSAALGTLSQDIIVSGTASGSLRAERQYFSTAIQVEQRLSSLATLSSSSAGALQSIGISRDSIERLLGISSRIGLPVRVTGGPSHRTNLNGSVIGRFDFTPNAQPTGDQHGDVLYLLLGGSWRELGGLGGGPTSIETRLTSGSHRDALAMVNYSPYLWSALSETQSRVSFSEDVTQSYRRLPGATVLLDSRFPDSTSGFAPLLIGGNGGSQSRLRNWGWETSTDVSWMTADAAHKFNVYVSAELKRFEQRQSMNPLGEFTYNTLQDLSENRPAMFIRTPTDQQSDGTTWQGVLAFSDLYYVSTKSRNQFATAGNGLTLQYGLRVDAERFSPPPDLNSQVLTVFGRRTSHVPGSIVAQPMIGFSWKEGVYVVQSGPATFTDTRSRVDGGFRVYRGAISPLSVANVSRQTGLAGAVQRLQCVGTAVPTPDWAAFAQSDASVPMHCADGSVPAFSQQAPSVTLFADDYALPQSWRSELNWNWLFSGHLSGNLGVSYARNILQADPVDLNFNGIRKFRLDGEAARPSFVSPSNIDPSSGLIAATESRISPSFAQVTELRSDLAATQAQFTAGITLRFGTSAFVSPLGSNPPRFNSTIRTWYSYADSRSQMRGFGGTTADDPRDALWRRGTVPRHTLQAVVSLQMDRWFTISVSGRLSSGVPFTPLVGSDINGDGYANDRAFVFDSRTVSESVVRTGMSALLGTATHEVKSCLVSQLSRIAGHNSCEGPWTATLGTVAISVDPFRVGLGNRGSLTLYVNNALGGLDQLLHGQNHLLGWGQPAFADPVLLNVRGFDAATQQFRYSVNPLFGSSPAYRAAFRPPFRIALEARFDISHNLESQALESFVNHRPEGTPFNANSLKEKLIGTAGSFRNNDIDRILQHADSLRLDPDQSSRLKVLRARFDAVRDSLYGDLAQFLVARKGEYSTPRVRERWHETIVRSVRSTFQTGTDVRILLRPEQLAWLRTRKLTMTLEYSQDWFERTIRAPQLLPQ